MTALIRLRSRQHHSRSLTSLRSGVSSAFAEYVKRPLTLESTALQFDADTKNAIVPAALEIAEVTASLVTTSDSIARPWSSPPWTAMAASSAALASTGAEMLAL
jgi:hypothetical protein